jgi:hypothetical protein
MVSDETLETDSGEGEVHLGWLVPGTVVCLGAGPMRMRLTIEEARDLTSRMNALLRNPVHRGGQCGCEPPARSEVDEAVIAARQQFRGGF